MIMEIFISDSSENLLVGNAHNYHPTPTSVYLPVVSELGNEAYKRCKLRVNDVILSILFTRIDNFTASRFLIDLKKFLEKKVTTLTVETVKDHYFTLLEMIKSPECIVQPPEHSIDKDIYIDVVERVEGHRTYGDLVLSSCSMKSLNLIVRKSHNVQIKTSYPTKVIDSDRLLITGKSLHNKHVLSFSKPTETKYFRLKKQGSNFTVESDFKGKFRHVNFRIPVGKNVYKVDRISSGGETSFDLQGGIVIWRFNDCYFKRETIKIDSCVMEGIPEPLSNEQITADFEAEIQASESPVEVVSCEGADVSVFWMRFEIRGKDYDLSLSE